MKVNRYQPAKQEFIIDTGKKKKVKLNTNHQVADLKHDGKNFSILAYCKRNSVTFEEVLNILGTLMQELDKEGMYRFKEHIVISSGDSKYYIRPVMSGNRLLDMHVNDSVIEILNKHYGKDTMD